MRPEEKLIYPEKRIISPDEINRMAQESHADARTVVSGQFLTVPLPEESVSWLREEVLNFISENVCELYENLPSDTIFGEILQLSEPISNEFFKLKVLRKEHIAEKTIKDNLASELKETKKKLAEAELELLKPSKRHEPVPLFQQHKTYWNHLGQELHILSVCTYCLSCDHFRSEAVYVTKNLNTGEIRKKVKEGDIKLEKPEKKGLYLP